MEKSGWSRSRCRGSSPPPKPTRCCSLPLPSRVPTEIHANVVDAAPLFSATADPTFSEAAVNLQAFDLAVLTLQRPVTAVGGYFEYDCLTEQDAAPAGEAAADSAGHAVTPPPPPPAPPPPSQVSMQVHVFILAALILAAITIKEHRSSNASWCVSS